MDTERFDYWKRNRWRPLAIEVIPADDVVWADRGKNSEERVSLTVGRYRTAEKFSVRFANGEADTVKTVEEDVSDYFESPFVLEGPAGTSLTELTRAEFPEIKGAYFHLRSEKSPDTAFVVTSEGFAWLVSLR